MAVPVPDPDMKEMRIMAYSVRTRSNGSQIAVPRRKDFIEVLWCLDDLPGLPEKWCPAEVLHVTSSPEQDILGYGILLYLPGDTWDEQSQNVEFLPYNKLRVRQDEEHLNGQKQEQESDPIENIPTLDWRFSGSRDERSLSRNSSDIEWTPARHESKGNLANEIGLLQKVSSDQNEMESLRNGHATLLVEVQKLKREMATLWKKLETASPLEHVRDGMYGSGNVILRLRHNLALKMQAALCSPRSHRKRKLQDSEQNQTCATRDGFQVGTVKARVDCTLQEFELISREIQTNAIPNSVYFFPCFSYTQLPNQSSSGFRILFSTLSHVLGHLGITSAADKLEMARKCSAGTNGELLRVICTYRLDEEDRTKPAYIFLGTSCGDEDVPPVHAKNAKAAQLFPVLFRRSRVWNKVDQRFAHDLTTQNVELPSLRESASELQAFSLSWKRSPGLGYRSWSQSLTQPAQVFGTLQIALPFIQTQGRHMCVELGGLATDETWSEVLSR